MISILIILTCVYLLAKYAQKPIPLDPGTIHAYIYFFTNISVFLLFMLNFDVVEFNSNNWFLWSKDGMVNRILFLNAIYVLFFSFFYLFLIKLFHGRNKPKTEYNHSFISLSEAFLLYLVLICIQYFLKLMSLDYIASYFGIVVSLSFFLLFSMMLTKIKTNTNIVLICIFYIFLSVLILGPLINYFNNIDGYTINRGGAISTVVFALVYVEITQRRKLFTQKNILLALVFLPLFLGLTNYVEVFINGDNRGFSEFFTYLLMGYEIRMMENQAIILNSIDIGETFTIGNTYLNSFYDMLLPFENLTLSPMNWFSTHFFYREDRIEGFGLSLLAEGMMNFNQVGVIVAALLNSILMFILRSLLFSKKTVAPILFAGLFSLCYYLYRSDSLYILKRIEFLLLSVFIIFIILILVRFLFLSHYKKGRG